MDIDTTASTGEAQEILSALRQIQDDAELRAVAETNPEGVMDRLGVSGIARHAVAFGIAGLLAAPVVAASALDVTPEVFWV